MNINEIVDPIDCAGTVFAKAILIYFIGTFFLIMAAAKAATSYGSLGRKGKPAWAILAQKQHACNALMPNEFRA
jgi:hypothetical protein